MGRPMRHQFSGACYHITLQGNNRQDIFITNQDRRYFLSLLKACKERYEFLVYAYCMMNNSADLLIETRRANLSRVMQGLGTVYTKYFNRAHNTTGHLFQGRYRALLVDKENYLVDMTCAVHLKPVRVGIKEKPWRYLWSSCAAYVESGEREPIVDTEPVLRRFAKNRLNQSVKYLHHIKERLKSGGRPSYPVHGCVVGTPEFAASLPRADAAEPAADGASSEKAREIIAEILAAHRMDEATLLGRSQWREISSVRKEAIYRIWKEAKLGVTEIGRMFRRTPSAVCQQVRAMEIANGTLFSPK